MRQVQVQRVAADVVRVPLHEQLPLRVLLHRFANLAQHGLGLGPQPIAAEIEIDTVDIHVLVRGELLLDVMLGGERNIRVADVVVPADVLVVEHQREHRLVQHLGAHLPIPQHSCDVDDGQRHGAVVDDDVDGVEEVELVGRALARVLLLETAGLVEIHEERLGRLLSGLDVEIAQADFATLLQLGEGFRGEAERGAAGQHVRQLGHEPRVIDVSVAQIDPAHPPGEPRELMVRPNGATLRDGNAARIHGFDLREALVLVIALLALPRVRESEPDLEGDGGRSLCRHFRLGRGACGGALAAEREPVDGGGRRRRQGIGH